MQYRLFRQWIRIRGSAHIHLPPVAFAGYVCAARQAVARIPVKAEAHALGMNVLKAFNETSALSLMPVSALFLSRPQAGPPGVRNALKAFNKLPHFLLCP